MRLHGVVLSLKREHRDKFTFTFTHLVLFKHSGIIM